MTDEEFSVFFILCFFYKLNHTSSTINDPPSPSGEGFFHYRIYSHRLTSLEPRDYRVVFVITKKGFCSAKSLLNRLVPAARISRQGESRI